MKIREGKILVADDEKATREILARSLSAKGFSVETRVKWFGSVGENPGSPFRYAYY